MNPIIQSALKEFKKLEVCECGRYCGDTMHAIETLLISTLTNAIAKAKEDERSRIIEEYGFYGNGCGCCEDENLKQSLSKETK